ncbi:MAG TPA: UDP-N-acetylmuramoyl-L-alanine--D-glutamate ligase [Clostridia bacterium]|nr:UDP-N-acetylmuramoyl-L-alanine--D-glutamate ligase [Clostridia bacterium]
MTGESFTGKRIAVVGLGISNLALARYLAHRGADLTLCDQKSLEEMGDRKPAILQLAEMGARLRLGSRYLEGLWEFEEAYLTPGMKKYLPEIERARASGTKISTEAQLFLSLVKAKTIGVTGSAGKTTTSTLIGDVLSKSGRNTYVGGNIGQPLIEVVDDIPENAYVVLELSSFQLELMEKSPNTALVLNVTLDHMDVHRNRAEYVAAKTRIFSFQKEGDLAIFNGDDTTTAAMALEARARVALFSRRREVSGDGAFLRGSSAIVRLGGVEREVFDVGRLLIPGPHNVENALAASICLIDAGIKPAYIAEVLSEFRGVEHRIEFVRELEGVRYYNDSIATTPDRTAAALYTLAQPIVLIAGGSDKNLPYDRLGEVIVKRVHTLITMGHTAEKIEEAVRRALSSGEGKEQISIRRSRDLGEAVTLARRLAPPGASVVLSPASASFDAFSNYKERGKLFKRLVLEL